jgi:predicted TIM-barrel fold metal-dependent hydrolase
MRNGSHVYDSDTHVNPSAEVLERYVDPGFRARLPELAQYRVASGKAAEGAEPSHVYRFNDKIYRRVLGQAEPHPTFTGSAREASWRGSRQPRPGIRDAHAENRLKDMDDEGVHRHFLIPSSWTGAVSLDDPELMVGLVRAYHRYMADFCAQDPDRLKSLIVAPTASVEAAVQEIHAWGKSPWAVAVMPIMNEGKPVDHPDLDPIWQAAEEHDLAIVHHSTTWNPPYFPGHQDLYDNIFLGRMVSHPWGGMRFVSAFIGAGIMDRYPRLRMGLLECGFGWLPYWARRMDEQAKYVGAIAPLKYTCSEYLTGGRFFCSIEMHEGEDLFKMVTGFLGDDVLMYASDYPHSECHFPDSVNNVLNWKSLKPGTRQKLMWDNADRLYKRT